MAPEGNSQDPERQERAGQGDRLEPRCRAGKVNQSTPKKSKEHAKDEHAGLFQKLKEVQSHCILLVGE